MRTAHRRLSKHHPSISTRWNQQAEQSGFYLPSGVEIGQILQQYRQS